MTIAGMTPYEIFSYFMIYAFVGWIAEVIYHAVTLGKVINRGFLNGPICPVYGFGALTVFATLNLVSPGEPMVDMSGWLVFAIGMILATAVELIAGWALDAIFHARWWDYSDKPFNFRGYICLQFSIIWGAAIVLVVKVFHPSIHAHTVGFVPEKIGWPLLVVMYVIFVADVAVSAAVANGLNKKLQELDKIRSSMRTVSDAMSQKIGTNAIKTTRAVEEGQVKAALAKAELKDATAKRRDAFDQRAAAIRRKLLAHPLFGEGRLLRAFPDMKHRKYKLVVDELQREIKKESRS